MIMLFHESIVLLRKEIILSFFNPFTKSRSNIIFNIHKKFLGTNGPL